MCSIIIISFKKFDTSTYVLDYSRKKNRGIEDTEFSGLLKK